MKHTKPAPHLSLAIADFNAALDIDPNDTQLLLERRKASSEKRFG